jgi:hypothetical protein
MVPGVRQSLRRSLRADDRCYNLLTMGNSWIGTLIVLVVVGAQVIPAILQALAKKRQERRVREAAEARRAQQIPEEFRTPVAVGRRESPVQQPVVVSARTSRADDLAARRKAQLEQLRNRRQGRPSGADAATGSMEPAARPAAQVQVRVGGPRMPGPAGIFLPIPQAPKRVDVTVPPTHPDVEAVRRRQEQAKIRERRTAEARDVQKAQTAASKARDKASDTATSKPAARVDDALLAADTRRRQQIKDLRTLFGQSANLRRVIILKELLDPPVSLR